MGSNPTGTTMYLKISKRYRKGGIWQIRDRSDGRYVIMIQYKCKNRIVKLLGPNKNEPFWARPVNEITVNKTYFDKYAFRCADFHVITFENFYDHNWDSEWCENFPYLTKCKKCGTYVYEGVSNRKYLTCVEFTIQSIIT